MKLIMHKPYLPLSEILLMSLQSHYLLGSQQLLCCYKHTMHEIQFSTHSN